MVKTILQKKSPERHFLFRQSGMPFLQGNISKMQEFQKKIYAQRQLYSLGSFQSSMIKGLKSALAHRGICQDHLAAPFNHFEKQHADEVQKILDTL